MVLIFGGGIFHVALVHLRIILSSIARGIGGGTSSQTVRVCFFPSYVSTSIFSQLDCVT